MPTRPHLHHIIVDGSNIATEGRDQPSLAQLDEAVQAFIREYEPEIVLVVVDATFPNRIDPSERKMFEEGIVAGEVITPPAGAIGRGDAFVLQIADRAGATVLSNDSFQEFHGQYSWLFDQGRLIGGKPVPHVGWVFMERAPVRGPASRKAVSAARRASATKRTAKAKPRSRTEPVAQPRSRTEPATKRPSRTEPVVKPTPEPESEPEPEQPTFNEAKPFADFNSAHPIGSEVEALVEQFGSHGAYLRIGQIRAYAPLKNLGDPAPRSAKEVLRVGEKRRFVVETIDPAHRGVDLRLAPDKPVRKRSAPKKKAAKKKAAVKKKAAAKKQPAKKQPAKKAAPKRSARRREA